jgi:integrase
MGSAVATGTNASYVSAARRFASFGDSWGVRPLYPLVDHIVIGWVSTLSLETTPLAPKTVKSYLFGLKHWHRLSTGTVYVAGPRVELALKGYTRLYSKGRRPRLAVTTAILGGIFPLIGNQQLAGLTLRAILSAGVFGLLRLGELLALRLCDISFEDFAGTTCMVIRIRKSKTDQFRLGALVRLYALPQGKAGICPVAATKALLAVRPPSDPKAPLWHKASGAKVSRGDVVIALRRLVYRFAKANDMDWSPDQFSGHSLRRGGATALFAAGMPADLIRTMGRWKSECYRLYLETSQRMLYEAQLAMASIQLEQVWPICPAVWDREE